MWIGDEVRIVSDNREYVPEHLRVHGAMATYIGICWLRNGRRYAGSHDQGLRVCPKFRLDDGTIVWATECWWEPVVKPASITGSV